MPVDISDSRWTSIPFMFFRPYLVEVLFLILVAQSCSTVVISSHGLD